MVFSTRLFRFNSRAPRGARQVSREVTWFADVSIHAPRVGRDTNENKEVYELPVFQFTRPAWGATIPPYDFASSGAFQFTRPAWGATLHLPRQRICILFQFTRPAWGATFFQRK